MSFHVHVGLSLPLPPSVSLHPSYIDLRMHHDAVTTAVEVVKIPTVFKHFLLAAIYCDKNTYNNSTTLGKGSSWKNLFCLLFVHHTVKCPCFFFFHTLMSSVLFCDCEKLLCTEVKQITQGHRADEWNLGSEPGLWTAGLTYGLPVLHTAAGWPAPSHCT